MYEIMQKDSVEKKEKVIKYYGVGVGGFDLCRRGSMMDQPGGHSHKNHMDSLGLYRVSSLSGSVFC